MLQVATITRNTFDSVTERKIFRLQMLNNNLDNSFIDISFIIFFFFNSVAAPNFKVHRNSVHWGWREILWSGQALIIALDPNWFLECQNSKKILYEVTCELKAIFFITTLANHKINSMLYTLQLFPPCCRWLADSLSCTITCTIHILALPSLKSFKRRWWNHTSFILHLLN